MVSPMSASPPLWRWAVEGGEPQVGTEDELLQRLSTGRVPPYALVWREGWGEWLPAMQVAALGEAFPELTGVGTRTARPSSIPGIPPVPISEYPRLRHLARVAPLGWPDGFESPEDEEEVITSEVPAAVMLEAARVMTQPSPPRDLGLQEAVRASRLPPERPSGLPRDARTPASSPALPLATELGLGALLAEAAPARSGAQWLRAHGLWLALGLVPLGFVALGLAATFGSRWLAAMGVPERAAVRAAKPSAAARSLSAALAPVTPAAVGCRVRQPAVQLDDWAAVDVRPVLHPLASGRQVAIGYAQSHRSATGGIIDIGALRLERQFWQQQERQVFSVTPLEVDGVLRYHVERQGTNVAFARALAAQAPVRLGVSEDALVIGQLDQRVQKLWPLPPGSTLTVPEVAEHPLGFTIALRAARDLGHLRVGLIDASGAALAPLAEVGSPDWDFGRPALASGPEQTVLAACHRGGNDRADEILLARAHNGRLPTELRRFGVPAPAAAELLAPVVAALPDGGFALMWSQGPNARRQVRLQRLSPELEPLGAALDLTPTLPEGASATAAALQWVDDRLLAFYFSTRQMGHSLWVGSVSCGA